jgi:ubiquinone/menaquinone biosynthesis C-methylase UbiE
MMQNNKWPKVIPPLTDEQQWIGDDFMKHWLEVLSNNKSWSYKLLEEFNQGYVVKHAPKNFLTTLEIGAGVGGHLNYEILSKKQKNHYVAIDIRQNMIDKLKKSFPDIKINLADCQKTLPYSDDYFDRILAIHVLEHLPNLPAALKEMHRLCHKERGILSVVIPCEGGWAYSLARKISTERIFARRYNQKFKWFIESEHINKPHEIFYELSRYFKVLHRHFFPLLVPSVNLNLCIGITLKPK